MTTKAGVRPDEGLMMMQELDDRLKEQIDKLEHLRLAAVELRDNLSAVLRALLQQITDCWEQICIRNQFLCIQSNTDLPQSIADHQEWLDHLSERVDTLHMNTSVFVQVKTTAELSQGNRFNSVLSLLPDESKASCLDRETGFQTWLPHGSVAAG